MPISIEDFNKLPDVQKRAGPAVSNEELINSLKEAALTVKEVAQILGVKNGTAYSRLKRLMEDNKVTRKNNAGSIVWAAI